MTTFDWTPISTWPGRYRDKTAGVLGYRPSEAKLISSSGDPTVIIPYTCKRCSELATLRHKGKCYCEAHRPKAAKE